MYSTWDRCDESRSQKITDETFKVFRETREEDEYFAKDRKINERSTNLMILILFLEVRAISRNRLSEIWNSNKN